MEVVCTGRGRHSPVSYGRCTVLPSGRVNMASFRIGEHVVDHGVFDVWQKGGLVGPEVVDRMHKTYPLTCRRCTPRRNVPLTKERLSSLCVRLAEAGASQLDISALHVLPATVTDQ